MSEQMFVKDKRPGFFMIENRILDDYGKQLGAQGIAVYCALCRCARNGSCFPSMATIGEKIGVSRRTVCRAINKLIALNLITRESGKLNGKSNTYLILPPEMPHSHTGYDTSVAGGVTSETNRLRHVVTQNKTNGTKPMEQDKGYSAKAELTHPPTPSSTKEKGTRIPEDFRVTQAHIDWAKENHMPNPFDHIGEFKDHWLAEARSSGIKRDWDATFRNRLRWIAANHPNGDNYGNRQTIFPSADQRREQNNKRAIMEAHPEWFTGDSGIRLPQAIAPRGNPAVGEIIGKAEKP